MTKSQISVGYKFIAYAQQLHFDREFDLPYIRKDIREFIQFVDPLIEDSANQQPAELIQLLRVALDYDRFITDDDMPSPDDVKIENLNQLQMAAARFNEIKSFLD